MKLSEIEVLIVKMGVFESEKEVHLFTKYSVNPHDLPNITLL